MAKFPYKNILEGVKHIWTKSQGPDAEGAAVTANPLTIGYKDAEGKATGVTPTNMLPVGDAAAQAKLADILTKLSADPATQTTLAQISAKIIAAPATEAKQDTLIGHVDGVESALAAVLAKLSADPATQTTLAAILAKIIAAPATEAKQDTIIGHVDGIEGALTTLNGKDFATQTTLAAILAKIIAAPATEAKQTALAELIGEVQAAPTANTLLARLKNLETKVDAIIADGIKLSESSMELYGSGIATRPAADTVSIGTVYMDVTGQVIYQSDGITWVVM